MRIVRAPIICFCLALLVTGLAGSVSADMPSPLTVQLKLPGVPELGQQATLDCDIYAHFSMKNVSLTIDLSPGIDLVKGNKTWNGDLAARQTKTLPLAIKVTSPGNKTITATVFCRIDEHTAFSDIAQVFFNSQPGFSTVGHITDVVPTQSAAACLETGEIVQPMKLSEYMKLPLQAPSEPEPCDVGPGETKAQEAGPTPEGTLVVTGRWCYYDRDDTYRPMEWVYVELRRGSDDAVLTSTWVTDNNGYYTFSAITNPGSAGFRVRAWCYHNNTHSCDGKALRVVPPGEGRDDGGNALSPCYSVQTGIRTSGDGTYDMGTWHVNNGDTNEPAWWIMMDLNKGFWWPYWWNDHTTMNGGVTVEWSSTSTTGDFNCRTDWGGNICLKAASPNVCDVVLHEYGHEVQWDGYGQWLPSSDCPSPHYFEVASGPHCAWYEGFANWYKFAVSNDPVYHWAGGGSLDCENSTWGNYWDTGDQVEGRVAGAMWDIGDSNADGYDTCQLSWEYIWDTWYGSANRDNNFSEFWTRWKNKGQPKHHPTKALYQNTIDYNTWPTFSGLPDVTTQEDTPINNAIDLWAFAYDPESSDSELEYQITGNTNPNCGVSIHAGDYVDINPALNWYGTSTVTISCTDGIRTRYDSFVVTVTAVNDPPVISGLPDRTVLEDHTWDNAIDLWAYTSDPETADSGLTFTITGNTNTNCGVSIDSNRYIDINPVPNWNGYSDVTVRATDPSGLYSSDTFRITVTAVNDPPVFTGLPDRTMNEDATWNNAIDLWAYASDETPDADLVFTITGNTNTNCGVSIDSNRYIDINPVANWNGYSDVTVRCTDTGGLWTEDTFRITVNPVNDPPTLAGLPDRLLAKNGSWNNAIDLWIYAQDEETSDNDLVYTITANTDPNCGVSIDAWDFVDIYPAANWTGYSDVTIRATDAGGLWAEDTFRIVVANPFSTISQARANPNGTWVSLTSKITTARFSSYYYIEEPDRSSGIRVNTASGISPGYKVTVAGPLSTSYAERQITPYYQQVTAEGYWIDPLGIRNDWLGGGSPDPNTVAVPAAGQGVYNVGLLVRTTGRVVKHASGSRFYISDGGKIQDNASDMPSVFVDSVPSGYVPPLGSYVSVTGISGASTLSGIPMRVLRPRQDADIVVRELTAAYILDTNRTDAEYFKALLDNNSVPTSLIYRSKVTGTDLSRYNVILIGGDTGDWAEAKQVTAVLSAGKPIIAIGSGGARFLDKVTTPDLYLGWLNSAVASDQTSAVAYGGNIYNYPYDLGVSIGQTLGLYSGRGNSAVVLYDPGGTTNRMLMMSGNQSYFPLASQYNLFYQWGFYGAADKMTDLGRRLFVNLVFSTAR